MTSSLLRWRISPRFRFFLLFFFLSVQQTSCEVTALDSSNIDSILSGSEIVFANFFADWCRFSQQLKPIFLEASEKFKDLPPGRVVFAGVDSDRNADVAAKYHVNKYPTLKLFRNGELVKKEYRGQRSVDALAAFVQKQLDGSIFGFVSEDDLTSRLDKSKRNVIAYFASAEGTEFENFKKVASLLREECVFWLGSGDAVAQQFEGQTSALKFLAQNSAERLSFLGAMSDFDYLKQWLTDKCIPLVREITFENAEELTEEGLPFLILFRHPDDSESMKIFTEQVVRELPDQKSAINCLVADGKKFAHPLHHLGKAERDLPLIAIDSFRHMFLFPDMTQLTVPGRLRQFVLDLHSGKLHREFHHGPDPTQAQIVADNSVSSMPLVMAQAIEKGGNNDGTQPPASVFNKLRPSDTRYTLLRDEL